MLIPGTKAMTGKTACTLTSFMAVGPKSTSRHCAFHHHTCMYMRTHTHAHTHTHAIQYHLRMSLIKVSSIIGPTLQMN